MARTRHAQKGPGHEFWGKRSVLSGLRDPGKYTKTQTHRAERRRDKKVIEQEKDE